MSIFYNDNMCERLTFFEHVFTTNVKSLKLDEMIKTH